MSFQHIVQNVFFEPWAIEPSSHYAIQKVVLARLEGVKSADLLDEFVAPQESYSVSDGIATIPVQGVMGRRLSGIEKKCGGVDTSEVAAMFAAALADPTVQGILMLVDSPGGMVQGSVELSRAIADAAEIKPVFAYTDGTMASAAYGASVGATQIYASESAQIGSIGTYMAILDRSEEFKAAGQKVEMFAAGKYKAAGFSGLTLSDEQKAYFQNRVDESNQQFQSWVSQNRPDVSEEDMQGQVFWADSALEAGLIDAVAPLDQALADLKTICGM